MTKTLELKGIVYTLLKGSTGEAYYENANKDANYPYKVFTFDNIDLGDLNRDNIILIVDVWGKDIKQVDEIADTIEETLNCANVPQGNSYPTFYRISRTTVPDEDKSIKHKQLKFQIQNYYIGA